MTSEFSKMFEGSPVPMSLSGLDDRRVVEVNDAYLETFGVQREQIIGRTPTDVGIIPQVVDRDTLLARLHEHASLHEPEVVIDSPRGVKRVMVWSRRVELDGRSYAMTTFLDLTGHRKAEDAARASDARLRDLAESIEEVFWLTDIENTKILYVSPAYEKIWGRSRDALYADARDWLAGVHPDERERMAEFTASLLSTKQRREEVYRIMRPDGTVRSIRIAVFPVVDPDGNITRVAGVGQDITDRLVLEEQVRQAQKLESLGLLAGGVAHDFNNILAVIASSSSLLAEVITNAEDLELVTEIDEAVRRATGLTRQLLAFSRKQVLEPVVLDLNAAVNETRKMLRRMLGEDIVIETSLDPDLGHVRIDPGYLVQVLMNLAVNARDAMPRGGILGIKTRNLTSEPRGVLITVTDTGTGMAPDVCARVFEPFFTTKGLGKGTGLGLSVVHGIIEQAGGKIEITSELGVGTSLLITLPHVDAPVDALDDVAAACSRGNEKIIVVDDDMFVRRATSRSLRSRGYDVLEASDGQTALRLLRDHGRDVSLLVTDVVMPGMDGCQLATIARERRPSLKVLYMSGYTDDALAHHGIDASVVEKPFAGHVLAGKVRQTIDAKR
jgi:two-component system cell cycle sensor histidine kinase/response regulator CckA